MNHRKIAFFLLFMFRISLYGQEICIDSSVIGNSYELWCLGEKEHINSFIPIDPVCGCDSVTYINAMCARLYGGVMMTEKGGCQCIDSSFIDVYDIYTRDKTIAPVCGCDGKTYFNKYHALFKHGITSWTDGGCECIEPEFIDYSVDCDFEFRSYYAVCGCDTVTYINLCKAFYHYGITSFTEGPCPCIVEEDIDTSVICPDIYDPVCGCDTITYFNSCIAKNHFGIYKHTKGECICIDSSLIDYIALANVDDLLWYRPVCGCDSITYFNKYYARYLHGIYKYANGACKCIDSSYINPDVLCIDEYIPIIGCDGNFYRNPCIARNHHGVMEYSSAPCQNEMQIDSSINCNIYHNYDPVCGCDMVTYHNRCAAKYYGGIAYFSSRACLKDSCIDNTLINPLINCSDYYDPVCGCDSITYINECTAKYKYGVKKWESGPCGTSSNSSAKSSSDLPILFPNPFSDRLTVELAGYGSPKNIKITDIFGRTVKNITTDRNILRYVIDMGDMPPGIYIAVIELKNKMITEKIVKTDNYH